MRKQLRTEIEIDAAPQQVWQILTDFPAYKNWNPFMVRASGVARREAHLTIRMQPQAGRAMTFPTVLEAEPDHRLRWLGRLLVPGLFDGEHCFTIEPLGEHRVRVVQQEQFRGVLVRLMAASLDRRTTLPAFVQMNQALKQRAEQVPA